jgi:thymidylate synthase
MNKIDKKYQDLLQDILDNGTKKETRNGGTISVFGRQIRHDMKTGFPLITTKKMAFKTMVTELLWFLKGDTNIKYLVDNNCHIWDGDCYANYLVKTKNQIEDPNDLNWDLSSPKDPKITQLTQEQFINKIKTDDEFAKKWGSLGLVYGKQWRSWAKFNEKVYTKQVREVPEGGRFAETRNVNWVGGSEVVYIDQIANLINDLKTNPDSRRLLVSAWNVADVESGSMVLPPCHYGFQVYTRELSLEDRLLLADKINKEIRQDLYSYAFNNPIYTGGIDQRPDDVERHHLLNDLNIPTRAISLMWNQRSCDFPLGIPANIMSYALLLTMFAKQLNMVPDELIGNLGDCHIYLNQIEGVKEQLTREPYELPTVKLLDRVVNDISEYTLNDIILENYQSHPKIYFPLSN